MPCFKILYKHSLMADDYQGSAYKYANTEDDALKLLAPKRVKTDSNIRKYLDKHGSILTILSINEEK